MARDLPGGQTGGAEAAGAAFDALRRQFLHVASRRVDPADAEDLVQEALAIIHERGQPRPGEGPLPPLAWCFQVLRNVVGNHYQRQRTRGAHVVEGADMGAVGVASGGRTPLESLEDRELGRVLDLSLAQMERDDPQCHGYLVAIVDGQRPHQVAASQGIAEAAFYRRLYRCRQKLRARLAELGVWP